MMVMMMATTPSVNASRRAGSMARSYVHPFAQAIMKSATGAKLREALARGELMTNSRRFIELRDQLLSAREDCELARREFRWPVLDEFNWVGDYFEVIAAGNDATALRMVDDAGGDRSVSFAAMAQRAAQVAAFLAGRGVGRGDRILVMLPNCIALWEVMLAAIRLGAVIIPATTLLEREDLRDRLDRGRVSAVVTEAALTARFAT